MLFNNSLLFNISYGQPEKTRAEILEAIHFACLDHLVDTLPKGLETVVGNHGFKISGGEKQRIALARDFLKKPALYIFIAHRLTSITDADTILVLDKGKIVEEGTHQIRLERKGLYAQLWFAQQSHPIYHSITPTSILEKQL